MNKVVFETPGTLDMRAVKVLGLHSKPDSENPIGFFGTGLKYAIAVALREDCSIIIETGGKSHFFSKKKENFRDKEFDFISMNDELLPYTTELGKGWKLWQAFRELYSNTLDEDGSTYLIEEEESFHPSKTYITVEGDAFVREFDERYNTFLRGGVRTGTGVQIIKARSSHVFYRGLRIMDLKRSSLFTYNILDPISLTEDRTAKYTWEVEDRIKQALLKLMDEAWLREILNSKEDFEASLDFGDTHEMPSESFQLVSKSGFNPTAFALTNKLEQSRIVVYDDRHVVDKMISAINDRDWQKFANLAQNDCDIILKILMEAERC